MTRAVLSRMTKLTSVGMSCFVSYQFKFECDIALLANVPYAIEVALSVDNYHDSLEAFQACRISRKNSIELARFREIGNLEALQ